MASSDSTRKLTKEELRRRERRLAMLHGANDLVAELNSGSDRGLIVLGATLIENELDELLEALSDRMPPDARTGFHNIISNFHRKVLLAYALGAISSSEFRALEAVRALRNLVAHGVSDFSNDKLVGLSATLVENLNGFPIAVSDQLRLIEGNELGRALSGTDDGALRYVQRNTYLIAVIGLISIISNRAVDVDERPQGPALKEYDVFPDLFTKVRGP